MEKYNVVPKARIPVCDRTVTSEISGDFTLPDYQPEIKRLLRISASVLPPSKYISERGAEFAGNIDYYVLYTGSDNSLYCAPITAEYKINIPIDPGDFDRDGFIGEYCGAINVLPDMISGRVMAPRKLNIKCRLKGRGQVFADLELSGGRTDEEADVQSLISTATAVKRDWSLGEPLIVRDEMICDNKDGEVRVIMADGKVLINEITSLMGSVNCRGDVYLKLLLCREADGKPYTVTRKMPFSHTVAVAGAESGTSATARGTVSEINITVDDGRIGIEVGMLVECETCILDRISFVKDVYSTRRVTENTYSNYDIPVCGIASTGNFTLSDSKSLDEVMISPGSTVVDICGTVNPDEYDLESGRCAILGRARFSLLLEKDGEYSTSDIELPFTYKTGASGDFDRAEFSCEIISARARVDGERIGIDAEIAVCGVASSYKSERIISAIGFGAELERHRGEIVICYPDKNDSLWSIAKRYGADIDRLAEINGLDTDADSDSHEIIEKVKYLVVQ